ncbi:MAG: hypothetical protein HY785_09935 [Oscillatoriophycideae cyanobacterium NC_groundwater_1537_Pr4_S-0.65um_50_18]|nr:hypothetical protein [Oscillatoriophycideae cyanobacterium NC_groundwater_1537_Pr4_S-0.65um_50_18]
MNSMNKIAAFSLTVASIVLLSSPTHAFPTGLLKEGVEGAAKHTDEVVEGAAKHTDEATEYTDDAIRGVPEEMAPTTAEDTPQQMLETGAVDAGLDPNGAVKGADQLPDEANDWEPAAAPAVPVAAGAGAVAFQEGSGGALPIAGGTTLALGMGYGIYRAIKGRG